MSNYVTSIQILDADGDTVDIHVETADGDIEIIGDFTILGRRLVLRNVHVDGPGPGSVRYSGLRAVARRFMEESMLTRFRFSAPFVPRVETPAVPPGRSGSSVSLTLRRAGPVTRPVHLARTLKSFGLRLGEAHDALNRIVADEAITLVLAGADRATMVSALAKFGVRSE